MSARTVSTNGVELRVTDAGDPDASPVVLCHGFPDLGYSWRHQLPALAAAGYHAVAPDQRGYGRSSRPDGIANYDIVHLTDDLLGLLDDLGRERAVFVGHDWGAVVVWALALRAPERVAGVVGMSVPFIPRGAERSARLADAGRARSLRRRVHPDRLHRRPQLVPQPRPQLAPHGGDPGREGHRARPADRRVG